MIEPTQAHDPEAPTVTSAGVGEADQARETESLTAPQGFELISLIGEGGMGAVFRARDLTMGRDVAVKILRANFTPRSAIGRRFIEEARITAQLQHPGIPPVHQVGELAGERPFLVMKLIKGDTLDVLLKQRANPSQEHGRFLAVFEQIAQAVGYAHAHRVIHRDLKPANVMVGSFGEVQVMDWGLAKVLDGTSSTDRVLDEAELATEIRSLREGAEATQAGSLLGTPAFMPPEQAIGAVDQVGERSDVFGLGAILCVILTGQPPFVSENAESTRRLAARCKLEDAFARLDRSGAEPELIALARSCLAPEPEDRPANGGLVAEAVSALRADAELRARKAEMDRARAEVREAEENKRRRVRRALALALLTLIAVAGFGAWRIESVRAERRADQLTREVEAQARQLATERDVAAALNETQVLRQEGWKQADDIPRWALTLTAARSSLKRAEGLAAAGEPGDELRVRIAAAGRALDQDDRDQELLAELDRIDEENDLRYLMPVMMTNRLSNSYAAAFRKYGVDPLALPQSEAVAWLKSHRLSDRLTIAVSNWGRARPLTDSAGFLTDVAEIQAIHATAAIAGNAAVQALLTRPSIRDRLKAIARAATDDPISREWSDALERNDAAAIKKLMTRPDFSQLSSRRLSALADATVESPLQFEHADILADLLSASYDRFPGDYWVNFQLALQGMLRPADKIDARAHEETIRYLAAAVAARPRSAIARVAHGMILLERNKDDPKGLSLLRSAAVVDPTSPWPHCFLAYHAIEVGDVEQMITAYQEAVRLDPETSYFMIFATEMIATSNGPGRQASLKRSDLARLYDSLIESHPGQGGGYALRAIFRMDEGDHRLALADFRKARTLLAADSVVATMTKLRLQPLESTVLWEEKLPAVLRGELKPTALEFQELAEYCAGFEKKYSLATRFMKEAFATDRTLFQNWMKVSSAAAWAVQAGTGAGADAASLSEAERAQLRTQALGWLRKAESLSNAPQILQFLAASTWKDRRFDPVRDFEALEKLPPMEREDWRRFWSKLPRVRKVEKLEAAPTPREVKR